MNPYRYRIRQHVPLGYNLLNGKTSEAFTTESVSLVPAFTKLMSAHRPGLYRNNPLIIIKWGLICQMELSSPYLSLSLNYPAKSLGRCI